MFQFSHQATKNLQRTVRRTMCLNRFWYPRLPKPLLSNLQKLPLIPKRVKPERLLCESPLPKGRRSRAKPPTRMALSVVPLVALPVSLRSPSFPRPNLRCLTPPRSDLHRRRPHPPSPHALPNHRRILISTKRCSPHHTTRQRIRRKQLRSRRSQ